MNSIMNYGFVSPYINFNFATGSIEPLNFPPSYFMSLTNKREVDKACVFTLTLMYAPGNFGDDTALLLHQLLLTSKDKDVTYGYGYITPNGGVNEQNQYYRGKFISYTESINDGYLTYTVEGVAEEVSCGNAPVNIETFMERKKKGKTIWGAGKEYTIQPDIMVQPSMLVEELLTIDTTSGMRDYFEDYDLVIAHTDRLVDVRTINVDNGCLHDVLFGKSTINNTKIPSGFVDYSVEETERQVLLDSGYLTDNELALLNGYDILTAHGASSSITQEMQEVYNRVSALQVTPYVCYYDNVVSSIGSNKKGTFYYVPKENRQITNIFTYNFGNSYIDSDVIDFSVDYDASVAVATTPALEKVDVNVDVNGDLTGSNYNILENDGFMKQSYNTLSGFNEAEFLTESLISENLNYPHTATLKVIGQIDCNKLLDIIRVNVMFNGSYHPGLSGDYQIHGIEDELTSDGFVTTFSLVRYGTTKSEGDLPDVVGNANDTSSRAYSNEQKILEAE